MKLEFNGILKSVSAVSSNTNTTTNKTNRRQSVIVIKPARKDEFDEPIGKEDVYELQVWNDNIEKLNVAGNFQTGQKVSVVGYMSGREVGANGNEKYFVDLKLQSIKEYQSK